MALAWGMVPDPRTIAALISSMHDEIFSLCSAILLVCAAQHLFGGTPVALDGLKRSSHASKEWSGRWADVQQKQAKLAEQVKR
jgi:hypothetical protein